MLLRKKNIRTILLSLAIALLPCLSLAQLLKYNSPMEVLGAALMSPIGGQQVLEQIFSHCSSYGANVRAKQDEAMRKWLTVHQAMIDENLRLRDEFKQRTTDEGREELKSLIEIKGPQLREALVRRYTTMVDVMPDATGRERICMSIAESVAEGKWNLEVNDPVVFDFLKRRLARREKSVN